MYVYLTCPNTRPKLRQNFENIELESFLMSLTNMKASHDTFLYLLISLMS